MWLGLGFQTFRRNSGFIFKCSGVLEECTFSSKRRKRLVLVLFFKQLRGDGWIWRTMPRLTQKTTQCLPRFADYDIPRPLYLIIICVNNPHNGKNWKREHQYLKMISIVCREIPSEVAKSVHSFGTLLWNKFVWTAWGRRTQNCQRMRAITFPRCVPFSGALLLGPSVAALKEEIYGNKQAIRICIPHYVILQCFAML